MQAQKGEIEIRRWKTNSRLAIGPAHEERQGTRPRSRNDSRVEVEPICDILERPAGSFGDYRSRRRGYRKRAGALGSEGRDVLLFVGLGWRNKIHCRGKMNNELVEVWEWEMEKEKERGGVFVGVGFGGEIWSFSGFWFWCREGEGSHFRNLNFQRRHGFGAGERRGRFEIEKCGRASREGKGLDFGTRDFSVLAASIFFYFLPNIYPGWGIDHSR